MELGAWSSGMPGSPTWRDSARFALRVREVTGSIPVVPLFFLPLRTRPSPPDDARGFFLVFGVGRRRGWRFCSVSIDMGVLQDLSHAVEPACAARAPRKAGHNTLMMSCDAPRQLTASSERFSRASPTIWSTGGRAGVRLALKVHEVRRDVHRAYTRCRPTPGPARARPRRRDLSSRGASARENAVVSAAPAPKRPRCAAGVDCFENSRPNGCGLVPDAGICSFSSPRSASELIKAAAARAKADPDAPEGLPVDMARRTHKGAKGVAGALARAQLATASLGNFDAMRRRSRRASAAPSGPRTARGRPQWSTDGDAPEGVPSGPRTATRPGASRASCPCSTRSRTATSARCCGSDARRTSGGAIRGARRGLAGVRLAGCRSLCDAKWTTRR